MPPLSSPSSPSSISPPNASLTHGVILTLVAPRAVEDALIDLLLAHPDTVPGFTTSPADGHGSSVRLVGMAEKVRGRAARVRVQMVVEEAGAQAILGLLQTHLPHAHIYYWLAPALAAGRIG